MRQPKLLLANRAELILVIKEALSKYELLETTTLRQAERLVIEDGIDCFVIGIHFDDSRALDLVKFIRSTASHKSTPIIVTRILPSLNAQMLKDNVTIWHSIYRISDYLELESDSEAGEKVRAAVAKCLEAARDLRSSTLSTPPKKVSP